MGVKILIDSASDISKEEAGILGVSMIPLVVNFGDEDYLDGVDLLPKQFYEKLIASKVLPKTTQVNPFRFEQEFEKMVSDGSDVVCITISSKLSGTYASAKVASEKFNGKVYVVDSLTASAGERLLCEYALILVEKGLSAKEVAKELDNIKSKVNIMAMIDTLEYLKKGGRISSVTAIAGEMFAIKPVVAMVDGEVKMIGKGIGSKRGIAFMNSVVDKKGGINLDMPYVLIWSGVNSEKMEKYKNGYAKVWEEKEIPAYLLGSTIGTHVGPGAVGIAFFEK